MNITIKKLNQEQIKRANNNSFGGKRGDIEEHEYEVYCNRIVSWNLSERKTQKLVDKVYDYFSKLISLGAQHVSVAVAGASNYNAKRLDKSDSILSASADFVNWFKEIEDEATTKPYSRIRWLVKNIIWGVSGEYTVNKQWKELAGRSFRDFEILYEELSKKYEFKKASLPYKIYHKTIEVEKITQAPIYANDDFCAYKEQENICIEFRMKPQRQLIVAFKSRKFVWISQQNLWRSPVSDDLLEWVKTIDEKYGQYI